MPAAWGAHAMNQSLDALMDSWQEDALAIKELPVLRPVQLGLTRIVKI